MNWKHRAVEYHQKIKTVRAKKFYRCGHCKARRVLNRELWEYSKPPKCHTCGVIDWCIDMYRYTEWKNKTGSYAVCHCYELPYPHRPGSDVWCKQHKTGPTEQDYVNRYGPRENLGEFEQCENQ